MSNTTLADADNSSTTASADDTSSSNVPEGMMLVDKKQYYAQYGKTKTLEKEYNSLREDVNYLKSQRGDDHEDVVRELKAEGFDEDEARKLVKVNQKLQKRAMLPNQGYPQPTIDPEKDAFLEKHPEAIQFIDEIDGFKKQAPSRRYEDIAKGFGYINTVKEKPTFQTSGNTASTPAGGEPRKTEAQEDQELDDYINKHIKKIG